MGNYPTIEKPINSWDFTFGWFIWKEKTKSDEIFKLLKAIILITK